MIKNIHIVGPSFYAGILQTALQQKLESERLEAKNSFKIPAIHLRDNEPETVSESDLIVLVLGSREKTNINYFTCATENAPHGPGLWRAAILIPSIKLKPGENPQQQFDVEKFQVRSRSFASNLVTDYFRNSQRGTSVSQWDMQLLHGLRTNYEKMGLTYNNTSTRLSHITMDIPSEVGRFVGHFLGCVALAAREYGLLDWHGFRALPETQRNWDRAHPWKVPPWCRVDLVVSKDDVKILEFDNNVGGWGFLTALQKASGSPWTVADKYRELVSPSPTFVLQPARKGYELETRFFADIVGGEAAKVVFSDAVMGNDGKVLINGEVAKVIHRRFDFHLANGDPSAALMLKAWMEGRLKINPPPISICSKLILAAVWDSTLNSVWEKVGLDLPWARRMIPETHLLDENVMPNRLDSVFKSLHPEKDWGARGVFVGPSESVSQWGQIITQAQAFREPAVVQSFCRHPERKILHIGDDGIPQQDTLKVVHRPFYMLQAAEDNKTDFAFVGGVYTASNKSKVHGGANSVFGLLQESQ